MFKKVLDEIFASDKKKQEKPKVKKSVYIPRSPKIVKPAYGDGLCVKCKQKKQMNTTLLCFDCYYAPSPDDDDDDDGAWEDDFYYGDWD
jgi:hypothetical protein